MRRALAALAFFALAAATASAAAAAPHLVYKVDRVEAAIEHGRLVVHVAGAVNSGGWTVPRLHLKESRAAEAMGEVIDFFATPPSAGQTVIQALVPITTTAVFPLPRYATVQVTVNGQSNSVTAPIAPVSALPPRKPYR